MEASLRTAKLFKISRTLFWADDESPTVFYTDVTSQDLKDIIHRGGGKLSDKPEDAAVLLCEKRTDKRIDSGYLPIDFVVECVKKNTFINTDKYRDTNLGFQPSTSKEKSSDDESDNDIMKTHGSSRIRVRPADMSGRRKYTDAEDFKIIKYLITHNKYMMTGGNVVWKDMQSIKLTDHTHQSMKARFQKKIVPDINSYDIPSDWKAKLIGTYTSSYQNGNQESSDHDESLDDHHEDSDDEIVIEQISSGEVKTSNRATGSKQNTHEQDSNKNRGEDEVSDAQSQETSGFNSLELDDIDAMIMSELKKHENSKEMGSKKGYMNAMNLRSREQEREGGDRAENIADEGSALQGKNLRSNSDSDTVSANVSKNLKKKNESSGVSSEDGTRRVHRTKVSELNCVQGSISLGDKRRKETLGTTSTENLTGEAALSPSKRNKGSDSNSVSVSSKDSPNLRTSSRHSDTRRKEVEPGRRKEPLPSEDNAVKRVINFINSDAPAVEESTSSHKPNKKHTRARTLHRLKNAHRNGDADGGADVSDVSTDSEISCVEEDGGDESGGRIACRGNEVDERRKKKKDKVVETDDDDQEEERGTLMKGNKTQDSAGLETARRRVQFLSEEFGLSEMEAALLMIRHKGSIQSVIQYLVS